jgi:transcriptional regulator with GAF, ATPase, and Fis domain
MPTEPFRDVLLEVWREACRHIEIHESAATIATMLERHLPLSALMIRRCDPAHHAMDTVAIGMRTGEPLHASPRTTLTPAHFRRVLSWMKAMAVVQSPRTKRTGIVALVVPEEIAGELAVGPLIGPDGGGGILILVAEPGKSFKQAHLQMAKALLDPFSAALENDRRLHELAALREAAEADRRSLLSRLGRQEMSDAIVGADSGLKHVMERVQLVAQSNVPVLILGETGTGKEVVSRAIHNRSSRAAGAFIRVNCGAIPAELIDSQLFGHEKGSFTGAGDTRQGWFERADGGTLFLDEIGELPLAAQVRLLRVLQDGFIERVGGQHPIRVDVRIVAATHCDLAAMVKAGTFREDLWYRINVFPILLPRLRERIEDIPPLARHFAQRAANRFGLALVEPTASDMQLLTNYNWPGNIRELGAVIDRAAILGNGQRLEVAKALGINVAAPPSAPLAATLYEVVPDAPSAESSELLEVTSLNAAMKRHIERALVVTRGRIEGRGGTAALLGINPHTLRARMRKLGIVWSRYRAADSAY